MTRRFMATGFLPVPRRGASALLGTIGVTLALLVPVPARGGPLTMPPAPAHAPGAQAGPPPEANAAFGKIPLHFEPNLGQMDPEVQFVARGGSYTAFITAEGVTLAAQQGNCGATKERPGQGKGMSPRDHQPEGAEPSRPGPTLESVPCRAEAVKLRIEGRAASARMVPEEPLEGRNSYFLGSDPSKWRTNVPHFASIRYEGVYPGVDLVLRPTGTNLRYDFEVGPQADPAQIRLAVEGVESTMVEDGVVVHRTGSGSRVEHRALKAASGSQTVSAAFELDGAGRISFRVGSWTRKEKLIIDPALVWGTFLGGSPSGIEEGRGVAVDAAGHVYVVGQTGSSDFPTTAGAYDTTYNGFMDVFVAKLNPTGSALLYGTLLGGLGDDTAGGIAVDGAGNAYVTGTTEGEGFPTTAGAFDAVTNGGPDAFVSKLNPTGTGLVYSTFLGGSSGDRGYGIAVDASGNAFVTGYTTSSNFPTTAGAYDSTANGYYDAFVTKLNPTGTGLVYSTFLGGSSSEYGN
ncbi:MAG: SBBP repeat-containing protein, partial [Deltaproteobacteria bacterium]|nr:SBBP repeat-containing protein [Deltaproteobacteria bacterium]